MRLALGAIPGSGRQAVPGAVLAFEIIVAGWAALHGYHVTFGPLALDPLISCWIILWGLTQLAPDKACGPIGEASGALGLLCHNQALALICFIPCLIENCRLGPRASGLAWQLAFLAPAGCYLAAHGFFPAQGLTDSLMSTGIDPTMAGHAGDATITPAVRDFASLGALSGEVFLPLAALATLPAFSAMPVLGYSIVVPALLAQTGSFWPVSLILLGGGLCLFLPLRRALAYWPLLLLGLTLSARHGGLADSALAGSEAFILSLLLGVLGKKSSFFQTPLPPLAGFLPFWLGLHVVNGLTGLSPAWTASGMCLSLVLGILMVRAWLASWRALSQPGSAVQERLGAKDSAHIASGAALVHASVEPGMIPSLTLGLCLSVCPGLLIGPVHDAVLTIAGAPHDIWRAWPVWSFAGGDGAFWYPALVFLVPAIIAPAVMTHLPASATSLPAWPAMPIRLRLPWGLRRLLASMRRQGTLLQSGLQRRHNQRNAPEAPSAITGTLPLRAGRFLSHQALVLWLLLVAMALSWLGWSA
ncbi:hypothetical protein [Asaia bogorensis]|uniref:hypothetical protein n=2 Tax=Asaia bogorensis TaxID=91915 RepID=UPI001E57776D|nr:hypothetical protein [Asaia bogorensis]